MVRDLVREWVDEKVIPIIEDHYAKGTFPMELMSEIGTMGLFGCNLKGYDCAGMSNVAYGLICQELERGDSAIRKAVEFAEDSTTQGWEDLKKYSINPNDVVIGIAASGTTPYVISALQHCNENNIVTGCITCNHNSPLSQTAQFPIEVIVGPEFVTGSSRMKAGTAQKLVLNMISTASMIQLGKVKGNKMVDMQLSNNKLIERAIKMVVENTNCTKEKARTLLTKYGSVREVINVINKNEN